MSSARPRTSNPKRLKVAFYTNLTARENLALMKGLMQSERAEFDWVIFYNTLREAGRSPLKILKEFGFKKTFFKVADMILSQIRSMLLRSPLRGWVRPQNGFEFVVAHQLPHWIVDDLNLPAERERLQALGLDLLLVGICKNILSAEVLQIPRLGAVNIHPSRLPYYRGPLPIFWMLYHGDDAGGVTFQHMTARIDDGPIVAQYSVTLDLQQSEQTLSRQLFELAADKLDEAFEALERAELFHPTEKGSYFSYPTAAILAELRNTPKTNQ